MTLIPRWGNSQSAGRNTSEIKPVPFGPADIVRLLDPHARSLDDGVPARVLAC
jgi:hypothetical protein